MDTGTETDPTPTSSPLPPVAPATPLTHDPVALTDVRRQEPPPGLAELGEASKSTLSAVELEATLAASEQATTTPPVDPATAADAAEAHKAAADTPKPAPAKEEPEPWKHQTIDFHGEKLEVRKVTQKSLAAFSIATSKHVPDKTRNDMTGLFLLRHTSEDTFIKVFSRLMDEDDDGYTLNTIGELMNDIVGISGL